MSGFLWAGLGAGALGAATQAYGMYQQNQNAQNMQRYLNANPYQANFGAYNNPNQQQRYQQLGAQQMAGARQIAGAGQEFAGYQTSLANTLQSRIAGQRPSVAELQMRQAQQAGLAQQQSALASQRGVAPGLAFRQAALGGAQMNAGIAGQAAQLRAQEQMAAEQQFGQLAAQGRQQGLQQAALGTDLDFNYLRQGVAMDEYQRSAMIQAEQARYAQYADALNRQLATRGMTAQTQGNMYNAASGGLAAISGGLIQAGALQSQQPQAVSPYGAMAGSGLGASVGSRIGY